jgi:hypothetical protein
VAKRTVRSGARRRPSPAGRKRRTSKAKGGSAQVIRLKPLYNEISRVLKLLEQAQKRRGPAGVALLTAAATPPEPDSIDRAIERLTQHRADFAAMCGPTMDIPAR